MRIYLIWIMEFLDYLLKSSTDSFIYLINGSLIQPVYHASFYRVKSRTILRIDVDRRGR